MTKGALVAIGSNSSRKLAEFDPVIERIQKLSAKAEKALKGHHQRVHQALVATYQLGLDLLEVDMLTLFIGQKVKSISAKQKANDFHELVGIAFPFARDDSKSKYRKVLKFVQDENWTVEEFQNAFAKGETLQSLYDTALDADKASSDTRTENDETEKFEQAKSVLDSQSIGTVTGLKLNAMQPHVVHGYANAVVRETPNGAEVVGFLPVGSRASFERALVSLVPTITDRTEKRLTKKRLYEFFVVCDVFARLQPERDDVLQQLKAQNSMKASFNLGDGASKEDVVKALATRHTGSSGKGITLDDIESAKQVLWLTKQGSDAPTLVQNGTILPAMIAMETQIDWASFNQRARELRIAAVDAKNFSNDFLRQLEWTDEHTSLLSHVTADDDVPTKYGFPGISTGKQGYRVLKSGGVSVHEFQVTKGIISAMKTWRKDFLASRAPNSKRDFPKLFCISEDGGYLWVSFPHNPMETKKLGRITQSKTPPTTLGSDWLLASRQLECVVELAVDYGLTFDGTLLSMAGAPFCIEFKCVLPNGPCKLTVPLTVGLAGGFVENTNPFAGPAALPAPNGNEAENSDTAPT